VRRIGDITPAIVAKAGNIRPIKHIRCLLVGYRAFFGSQTPGYWARYDFFDDINGARVTVEGSNENGVTWTGDVASLPFANPLQAWHYAIAHGDKGDL